MPPAVDELVGPAVMISACGVLMIAASTRHASLIARLHALHRERIELASRLEQSRRSPTGAESIRFEGLGLLSDSMLRRARALRLGLLGLVGCVICMVFSSAALAIDAGGAAVWLFGAGLLCLLAAMIAHVVEIVTSLGVVELEHRRVGGLTLEQDASQPTGDASI